LAALSSLLFASAHLYYGVVYQAASLTIFVDLFAFGMGMSFIHYFSGGNLFVPAVLHGLYDAAGFASVVLSASYEVNLKLGLVLLGFVFAVAFYAYDRLRGRTLQLGKA
jgi:membrane protease YdiL (CAAX protease family)